MVDKIYLEPTLTTPRVILDRESGVFLIQGKSLPEDVKSFYHPLIIWLDSYQENPNPKTVFEFDFEYFNTASSKMLLHLMNRLKMLHSQGYDVEIIWRYPQNDAELEEAGEELAEIIKVPFKILAKPEQ
ncbi:DUF1987 domain-containing protein [Tenuifilum thalassicum]|uniref:DUF1987 domain-containing protein n=1 Tax=Tenuifilum thalassicum TaxID=2590900 RepID=A0A7D4CGL1_9BACT|nr:DUF1987 domain-containing protein [Tenuifilum thalassicum]QKG79926.1 DUF1987 domain-containing protein [Tenuifilum thalassicum]